MIAILTNSGSLQIARTLSGGELFLVYEAALLNVDWAHTKTTYQVATSEYPISLNEKGEVSSIDGATVVSRIPCTGLLPVQVSEGESIACAVDFDFNTQLLSNEGLPEPIQYQAVCMLGRRYRRYGTAEWGKTYHYGDHVWFGGNHDTVYICRVPEYEYTEGSLTPPEDPDHWLSASTDKLISHYADASYYSDPEYDTIVMHVTAYDDSMTMGNGIEWEYKVRVFLDNLVQNDISKIEKFAQGTEANGSLILSFMAEISLNFKALRDMVSPIA